MAQITDTDPTSNEYYFLTNFDETFGAGKNAFVVNCTDRVLSYNPLDIRVYDPNGNELAVARQELAGSRLIRSSDLNGVYIVTVPSDTPSGIGNIEIHGRALDLEGYTGSFAFYKKTAYRISENTKLPLIQAPNTASINQSTLLWKRNILIDTSYPTKSEVRFFDLPYIDVTPEIYAMTKFPSSPQRLASGSCSSIAVVPKNNADGDFDYTMDEVRYQLYHSTGDKFTSAMEGEKIRIKNPYVRNFTYTNYSDKKISYEGVLQTDFIATIDRVINENSLLLNIPFSTVSDLTKRANEDSVYAKNNLVNIRGYNINDDPMKQTMYHKNNFYTLSISRAEYEIFYNRVLSDVSANLNSPNQALLDVEFNNLRTFCGSIASYKIYGKSLSTPATKTLLTEGYIEGEEVVSSKNFKNGLYNSPGKFYTQTHANRFWINNGSCVFSQSNEVFIDGAKIGHAANPSKSDFLIFKDDTSGGRTSTYLNYNLESSSYWYAKSDAFVNSEVMPTASYNQIYNIPLLSRHTGSQENLINGSAHDSNPIKLRRSTLYNFSMYVRPDSTNTSASEIYVYFLSGPNKKLIGKIDNTFRFGANELYNNTFFSDVDQYGTIIIVPISGQWFISSVSLKPYMALDYSIDSFAVKIPIHPKIANEMFEIEAELYDQNQKLAYGAGSYSFVNNKIFEPLRKRVFIDPNGITLVSSPYEGYVLSFGGNEVFP
jgi:hypothetical protein